MSGRQPGDFMARAIELSEENVRSGRGGPFAAVVVRNGRVVAEGTNLVTSSCDPTAHAEIVAIRRACQVLGQFHLAGCEIYASCEPCPMCFSAIYWARLDRLVFAATAEDAAGAGFDDSRILEQLRLAPERRRIPAQQLMREQALGALRAWVEKADKIPY
ncbi:MAG TPA: nucleoside deaminase [Candidatus Acidoferrales bacterium]|nr:nucleoside deaminase [Candidatus Acidoferrales bacterium]